MTDEEALLLAIVKNRRNLTPRLIYADWLEERGDPRAEVLRLQYTLKQLDLDAEGRDDLQVRLQALIKEHGDPLRGVIPFKGGILRVELLEHAWRRRVVKVSGAVNARVEFNSRSLVGLESVSVDGEVVSKRWNWHPTESHHDFDLAGPGGLLPTSVYVTWSWEGLPLSKLWLRLVIGQVLVYSKKEW